MNKLTPRMLLEKTSNNNNNNNNNNNTAEVELSQANFDTNMIIILAALLCALICALGLNSIVRCVLRCSSRDLTEENMSRVSNNGLKKNVLRKIPIFVYGRDHNNKGSGGNNNEGVREECPICLGEFVDGDKVRVLPKCNHGFHVGCIDTWLVGHSSCPNCRHLVVDEDGDDGLSKAVEAPQNGGGGDQDHVVVEMSSLRS